MTGTRYVNKSQKFKSHGSQIAQAKDSDPDVLGLTSNLALFILEQTHEICISFWVDRALGNEFFRLQR